MEKGISIMRIDTLSSPPQAAPRAPLSSQGVPGTREEPDLWALMVGMRQTFRDLLLDCAASWQADGAFESAPARQRIAQRLVAEWAVFLTLEDRVLRPRLAAAGAPAWTLRTAEEGARALEQMIEALITLPPEEEVFALRVATLGRLVDEHLRQLLTQVLAPLARAGIPMHGLGTALTVARDDLLAELADQANLMDRAQAPSPSA